MEEQTENKKSTKGCLWSSDIVFTLLEQCEMHWISLVKFEADVFSVLSVALETKLLTIMTAAVWK